MLSRYESKLTSCADSLYEWLKCESYSYHRYPDNLLLAWELDHETDVGFGVFVFVEDRQGDLVVESPLREDVPLLRLAAMNGDARLRELILSLLEVSEDLLHTESETVPG